MAEEIIIRLEKLEVHDDNQRRSIWATIQTILKYEAASLTEAQRQRLGSRTEYFLGNSLRDRIHRYVGRPTIVDVVSFDHLPEDQRPPAIVARLADEAMREPDVLRGELSWLMSRDAEYAWHFGYRLGGSDEGHIWLDELVEVAKASKESLLLSAYLQGRADAGESEWREYLLDEWMQNTSHAPLIFDAIWRVKANTHTVRRLIKLVDQGTLAPATLSRLVSGGWICSLDAMDVSLLLERLARDASPAVSEAGLALLTQWIEAQKPGGIPESLTSIAWTLVERAVVESTQMLDFYWRQVGLTLLQQDPVRITQAVLRGVATGNIMFIDERFSILRRAFTLKPVEIWEVLADQLLSYEELSYGLREWFQGNSILDELDADSLLAWTRQEPERRPKLLARLVKPKETITPLVRGLLKEYGPESVVANILVANFNTGSWSGSWIQHETQRLETMKKWSRDPEPNVRLWAQSLITATQQYLSDIRRMEEEGWPYPTLFS
ncbi:MAG TPA: hypothetical protein VKR06_25830 [Ktedonosporobacter sp.]|nr:hypothetical protein [Ktedonosporobacter sp.]